MLTITTVSGNIIDSPNYKQGEKYERLRLSRAELGRCRMRRRTVGGVDVGLELEPGKRLRHGDVLSGDGKTIVVEQIPEKILSLSLPEDSPESHVLVGHAVGNLHRPISIKDNVISLPIQSDSEVKMFEALLSGIAGNITLSTDNGIFTPHAGADLHGHD